MLTLFLFCSNHATVDTEDLVLLCERIRELFPDRAARVQVFRSHSSPKRGIQIDNVVSIAEADQLIAKTLGQVSPPERLGRTGWNVHLEGTFLMPCS